MRVTTFKPQETHKRSFAAFDIVLIDEASMINNELWGCCRGNGAVHRCEDYLMGDAAQLPPVNEEISPVFSQVSNRYSLTKLSVMWLTN